MGGISQGDDKTKRLIRHIDAGERLQTHILITGEANLIKAHFTDEAFPITGAIDYPSITTRLQQYAELTSPLLELLAVGCYGGNRDMAPTWTSAIELIAEYPQTFQQYHTNLMRLRLYPALLLAYASGVAAVAGGNYGALAALLARTRITDLTTNEDGALSLRLFPQAIMEPQFAPRIFADEPEPRDLSSHLRRAIRSALSGVVPSDRKFSEAFDRFESFLALTYADLKWSETDISLRWIPTGSFHRRLGKQVSAWEALKMEASADGERWQPLQAGFFQGSSERFNALKNGIDQFLGRSGVY